MPTSHEEKIAQIETALRQRFFSLVPKVELPSRVNWTEADHDTNRLTRALAAYTLVGLCEIDDVMAAAAITDGSDDGGIDALYFDQGTRLLLIQSKFKRNGACPSQAENLKTINGVKSLMARRFNEFNQNFQNRLDEIEVALDTPGVQLEIVLAFLGDNLSPHVTNDLNGLKTELNRINPIMDWHSEGLSAICGWLVAEQTQPAISVTITLDHWAAVPAPRKAVYGQISAVSLAQLVHNNGKALFQRNIRHYLGSVRVNTAIEGTALNQPEELFYLNNGITATAERIIPAPGNPDRCNFNLINVSIVNGAQTAGSIANVASAGQISDDAKLFITVIETGQTGDNIGLRVTRARNSQTTVRGVDFAALDPHQERLRRELATMGITYHYRPSAEARVQRDDAFTVEDAAISISCLSFPIQHSRDILQSTHGVRENAINYIVTAKKEVGRLWEQDGTYYGKLFGQPLSGLWMCRLIRIYRFVDRILAGSEKSEDTYNRKMFFRHGRYFIMAFVAHRSPEIINRPSFTLSTADETTLSQCTNELAELIYAQSQPMLASKGYLAIFRNLTDAQPLADGVLDRLTLQDAATTPVQNPTITPQSSTEVQP